MARKVKKKKKGPRPSIGMAQLSRIAEYMLDKDFDTAYDMLSLFLERHPDSVPGLQMMTDAASEVGDVAEAWRCSWKLARLIPNDPMALFNAATISGAMAAPFATLHYAEQYLKRWPDGEFAEDLREIQEEYGRVADAIRATDPINTAHPVAHLALLDECNLLTGLGYFRDGRAWCLQAIKQMPDVPAPRNNLASTYAVEGDLEEAIRIQRETVEKFPTNFHGRCNLAQFLARYGQRDEARRIVAQLEQESRSTTDMTEKLIETLSYLGDDAALVQLYRALRRDKARWEMLSPMTRHLLAVGLARTGEVKEAQKVWKQALKDFPDLELIQDNLDDLKEDVSERSGAWPFPINNWVPVEWIEELLAATARLTSENAEQRVMTNFLKSHPALGHSLPILLERGDPVARQLALGMLKYHPIPELVDYLRSPFGTDSDRFKASQIAVEAGLLARGQTIPMLQSGEVSDLLLMNYEITGEPSPTNLSKKAQDILEQCIDAIHAVRNQEALDLARRGLELAPDEPAFLNQEAALLQVMGQKAEARRRFEALVEKYPDYLFARCAMARLCAEDKQIDQAQEWLKPILSREQFHVSEFTAFAIAQIEVLEASGQHDGARQWLQMWEQADPDHPGIPIFKRRLGLKWPKLFRPPG